VRELVGIFEVFYGQDGHLVPPHHLAIRLDPLAILLSAGNNILQVAKGYGPLSEIINLAPKTGLVSQELLKKKKKKKDRIE
jgi:hypothetical protein